MHRTLSVWVWELGVDMYISILLNLEGVRGWIPMVSANYKVWS